MSPLCRLRRFLGLTQIDVALATGISVSRISLSERGSIECRLTDSENHAVSEYLADRLRILSELEQGHDFRARGAAQCMAQGQEVSE
jgi:transcriptional regulator with XRE-family HTH domain